MEPRRAGLACKGQERRDAQPRVNKTNGYVLMAIYRFPIWNEDGSWWVGETIQTNVWVVGSREEEAVNP